MHFFIEHFSLIKYWYIWYCYRSVYIEREREREIYIYIYKVMSLVHLLFISEYTLFYDQFFGVDGNGSLKFVLLKGIYLMVT